MTRSHIIAVLLLALGVAIRGAEPNGSPTLAFNESLGLTRAGRWDAAAAGWRKFLDAFADDSRAPHARLYLAHACQQQKDFSAASEAAEQLLDNGPAKFPHRPTALFIAGQARLEQGRAKSDAELLERALRHFRQLTDKFADRPEAVQAGLRIGETLDLLDRPAEAADEARRWLARNPKHENVAAATYLLGRNQIRAGQFAAGVETLDGFLADQPTGSAAAPARLLRSQGLVQLKRTDEAFAELAHVEGPAAAEASFRAGCLHWDENDRPAAIAAFQTALERKPAATLELTIRYRLAWSHFQSQDYRAAVAACEELVQRFPSSAQGLHLLAATRERLTDWRAARSVWQSLAALKTEHRIEALLRAGDAAWLAKDADEAAELYETVLAEAAESDAAPRAELGLGRIRLQADNNKDKEMLTEAESLFRRVTARQQATVIEAEAAYWLGESLRRQDKRESAADQFARAAGGYATFPEWAGRCWFQAGTTFESLGQAESATRCFDQLVKSYPEHSLTADARRRLKGKGEAR